MSQPTVRAELANAIRVVNAAFRKLGVDEQSRVRLVPDAPLDVALLAEDRDQALAQIESWRDHQLAAIAEADQ